MNLLATLQVMAGFVLIIFVPGLLLTFIFFPKIKLTNQDRQDKTPATPLDWFERILLSLAFSLATVPLVLFLLNRLGMKITQLNAVIAVGAFILLELAFLAIKYYSKKSTK